MRFPRFSDRWSLVPVIVWFVSLLGLSYWSYILVDPNLTLLNWQPFVAWQTSRWQLLQNPQTYSWQYAILVGVMWLSYLGMLATTRTWRKYWWVVVLGSVGILLLGHNALSRDIYNYMFNAKMVVRFGADPHVKTALDFSYDPWVRFMHNIHTPAPYGQAWTLWTVIPFVLSRGGKIFLATYLAFRAWMVVGFLALLGATWFALRKQNFADNFTLWALLALNPLIVVETLQTGHNDVWMMAPVVAAYGIVATKRRWWHWLVIVLLLAISILLKWATLLLVPLFIAVLIWEMLGARVPKVLHKVHVWLMPHWADFAAICMVVPLLTPRSQQFHPWYATWFLVWLPFGRWQWLRWSLLGLSLSSQLRYMPWMLNSLQYNDMVQWEMRVVTWSGLLLGFGLWAVYRITQGRK